MTQTEKPTVCVDFDGVLHAYISGWQGADVVADGPVPGAMEWLFDLACHYNVAIYSSRSSQAGGIEAMRHAIRQWILGKVESPSDSEVHEVNDFVENHLSFPTEKPAAMMTIDDRAMCFNGDFDEVSPAKIENFKPWYQREDSARVRMYRVLLNKCPSDSVDIKATDASVQRESGLDQPYLYFYRDGELVARFAYWTGYFQI